MAIDDNTTYGLTGAQVKELPEKINAVKGLAKELTADDYNYPTDNPTGVALWLLPSGVYSWRDGVNVWRSTGASVTGTWDTAIVTDERSSRKSFFIFGNASGTSNEPRIYTINTSNGTVQREQNLLTRDNVRDNLTSTQTYLPLSANQGRVLKNLVDSLAIRGAGAPTTSTVGQVGTLYEDTTNGDLYICTDATNPYVWEAVGGGGGPTVVQTTGTSTTDVMSQNAATSMIYNDPATRNQIKIGRNTSAGNNTCTLVGSGAKASGNYAVALGDYAEAGANSFAVGNNAKAAATLGVSIGYQASATANGAIALGSSSSATSVGEMNIGTSSTSYGYNSTNYRLLTGVHDPQNAHDAATKGYVDGMITMTDTDPGEGATLAAGKFIAVYDSNS